MRICHRFHGFHHDYRLLGLAVSVAALAACGSAPPPGLPSGEAAAAVQAFTQSAGGPISGVTRDHLSGDVYHYGFVLRVGDTANAKFALHRVVRERAPWVPRKTPHAAMLLHGDFATFATNFAPTLGSPPSTELGLAVFLAEHDIDVWGLDRRWTQAPAQGADLSDFAAMGAAAEIGDIGHALAIARGARALTGSGDDELTLIGFSHGGELAYAYAISESARPERQRLVKGLAVLDFYGLIPPGQDATRQFFCDSAAYEQGQVQSGVFDSPNDFIISTGGLFLSAPTAPSPLFPGLDNRGALLLVAGQTSALGVVYTPQYHLAAGVIADGAVTSLWASPEPVVATWFAGAAPHQSMQEGADLDALVCGQAPLPVDYSFDRIRVPLLYLGAAGGTGAYGLYTTTQTSSTDVTTLVIHRYGPGRVDEDFGHGDLLLGRDAPALAWQPLAAWIQRH